MNGGTLRRDQTRFWASGELMSLRAEDGTAVGFVKIVRDRTERWLREQKQLTLAKLGESLANMVEPSAMGHAPPLSSCAPRSMRPAHVTPR